MEVRLYFALLLACLLIPNFGLERFSFAESCSQALYDLMTRHTDRSQPPKLMSEMKVENENWLVETVRTSVDADPALALSSEGLRTYRENFKAALTEFDTQFRAGKVSGNLREVLKKQQTLQIRGAESKTNYTGTVRANGSSQIPGETPGQFRFESPVLRNQRISIPLKYGPYSLRYESMGPGPWTGPGRKLIPPPNLPGPFPDSKQTWELWFEEIANKARARGVDPREVMPKTINFRGDIVHTYPEAKYVELYLDRMAELMREIEGTVLGRPETSLGKTLELIADYYQVGINAHIFTSVNNSILMGQINYLLHYIGLRGVPHEHLDYLAMYKLPTDFRNIFIEAVRARNPGIRP